MWWACHVVWSLFSLFAVLSWTHHKYFPLYFCRAFGCPHFGAVCVCVSWLTENAFLVSVVLQVESLCASSGKKGWRHGPQTWGHPVLHLEFKVLVAPGLSGPWEEPWEWAWPAREGWGTQPLCALPSLPQLAWALLSALLGRQLVFPPWILGWISYC